MISDLDQIIIEREIDAEIELKRSLEKARDDARIRELQARIDFLDRYIPIFHGEPAPKPIAEPIEVNSSDWTGR